MTFESIDVIRYGCLVDRATGDDALAPIVVVLGPNESGKSTFFDLACTLLYGFRPAGRDRHPYVPWTGGDAEARARIRLGSGETHQVHRRLRSTPWGKLFTGDRTQDLRNHPVPWVDHVSRAVYRQVYALTLGQLASLERESWALVQDRLLGALATPDLRSAREVATELEDEAGGLWRPDRRGRPLARVLGDEIGELRTERRDALARERELRERVAERAREEEELVRLRAQRVDERARRDELEVRLNRLLPVRRALARIEELRELAGSSADLESLLPDPGARHRELSRRCAELEDRIRALESRAEASRGVIDDYSPWHCSVVDARERVREAAGILGALSDIKGEIATAEGAVVHLEEECASAGEDLFSAPWTEIDSGRLDAISESELELVLEEYEACRQQVSVAEQSLGDDEQETLAASLRPSGARAALGLVLLLAGITVVLLANAGVELPVGIAVELGAWVAAIGGFCLLLLWADGRRRASLYARSARGARTRRRRRVADLQDKRDALRARLAEQLGELPIRGSLLDTPGVALQSGIRRMRDLLARLEERRRIVEERYGALARAHEEIQWLERLLAVPTEDPDRRGSADDALAALEAALTRRDQAEAARRDLDEFEAERNRLAAELDRGLEELRALEGRLTQLGDGSVEDGVRVAAARIEASERAGRMEEELARSEPELEVMARLIRDAERDGETWQDLETGLEGAEARRLARNRRIEELVDRAGRLDVDIRHLCDGDSPARVEGRIGVLERRVADAMERRDRAFVLARLLRTADRRFRDEHQPDLLRGAASHLDHITSGRYNRIEVGDVGDESLYLGAASGDRVMKVAEPLSQGTKEQVYLALRLAIIDHLDADGERLPLFMDEVLVNWDAWRRDRAFELLEHIARRRQVFFFTCHPAMAAEMEDRGAAIVSLQRP